MLVCGEEFWIAEIVGVKFLDLRVCTLWSEIRRWRFELGTRTPYFKFDNELNEGMLVKAEKSKTRRLFSVT
jgi:hypothetical protein